MKTFKITLSTLFLGAISLFAADGSVDAQIAQINNASEQEKVKLMNAFKLKLSTLSAQEREEAVIKLQEKTQTKAQIRERIRVNQAEQTESMKRSETMNQHQIASQAMQQATMGSGTQMKMGK